jgi:hypothetical protein
VVFLRCGKEMVYDVNRVVVWCGCPCDAYLVLVHNLCLPCLPSEASHGCVMFILIGDFF